MKVAERPKIPSEPHFESSLMFFEEGKSLIDKDHVQACGKLYKAAEEAVKAITVHLNLKDILSDVEKRGEWSYIDLQRAVTRISRLIGGWFRSAWDAAWTLQVACFQEKKLGVEDVKLRLPEVEMLVSAAQNMFRILPLSFIVEYVDRSLSRVAEDLRVVVRGEFEKPMSELRSQVDKLREEAGVNIGGLRSEISSVLREIEAVRGEVEKLTSKLSSELAKLSEEVVKLRSELEAFRSDIYSKSESLKSEIVALKGEVESTKKNIDMKIGELNSELSTLKNGFKSRTKVTLWLLGLRRRLLN